jgi:hypothetical protein
MPNNNTTYLDFLRLWCTVLNSTNVNLVGKVPVLVVHLVSGVSLRWPVPTWASQRFTILSLLWHEESMKLILKHLTFFLLVFVLMSTHFICGKECNRSFTGPSGLTRHRQNCKHWNNRLSLQSQHFKRISTSTQETPAPKRIKLSAAQASNFSASCFDPCLSRDQCHDSQPLPSLAACCPQTS